jgi:Ca-activated chloride channel family protein
MKFAQPLWLLVGLAACAFALWRYRRYDRRQRTALTTFASQHLVERLTRSLSPGRRTLKRILVVTGIACLFLTLARPQAGFRWEETKRKGLDILFAVDTSKSMLAQDVKPDRLTRARMAVSDLVDKLNGDGVGLIAFAGRAFLQSPVTLDYDAFRESLNALDTTIIPRPGTDIAAAIHEAQAAFHTQTGRDKILVLVTDGEDLAGNAITTAEAAAKDGVKIFTVGVGSANGELIPIGGGEFAKDANGQIVKSKLDEATLKKIAKVTGGIYQPLGQQGEGLNAIYTQGLASFTRHNLATRQHRVYLERFQWPLLTALLCFVADWLIGTRKRSTHAVRKPDIATSAAAIIFALIVWPSLVQASPQSAEKAYQKGDFAGAQQQYEAAAAKTPAKPELQFNAGSAAYKAAAFDTAEKAFQRSLKTDQVNLQQDTYYNLGNTQYRLGQKTEKSNPQQTIQTWEEAVQFYEAALQIKSDDADARFNRDFVKKKLEELKKQQQRNDQSQQNKDQKDRDQKNTDQKDQQQNQQDQQKQDGQDKQDQQKQDQKQQAGNQPQQSKPESGKNQQDKKDQQAKSGQRPQPAEPKDQEGKAPKPDNNGEQQEQAESQRVPGQMTREEAKNLLDSVKNDDRPMPVSPLTRGEFEENDDRPTKDW